jgi:hypothetical protein
MFEKPLNAKQTRRLNKLWLMGIAIEKDGKWMYLRRGDAYLHKAGQLSLARRRTIGGALNVGMQSIRKDLYDWK